MRLELEEKKKEENKSKDEEEEQKKQEEEKIEDRSRKLARQRRRILRKNQSMNICISILNKMGWGGGRGPGVGGRAGVEGRRRTGRGDGVL